MTELRNLSDYLIILLSTDWFMPYWTEIGINIDEAMKTGIEQGSREIVKQIMNGADDYYRIDLSPRRRLETENEFVALLRRLDAETEVTETLEEWSNLSHEKLSSLTWYLNPTLILVKGKYMEGKPDLDISIQAVIINTSEKYDWDPSRYCDICKGSKSEWDIYTHGLMDNPEMLGIILWKVLMSHQFRAFWADIRQQLTTTKLEELKSWYRAMTMNLLHDERPDLIPPYI
jgi:hypothetical protein